LTGESPAGRGFDRSPLIRSARSLADSLTRAPAPSPGGTAQIAVETSAASVVVGEPA